MTFNDTDPTTWTDPDFHPDFGVDSAKYLDMLRACSTALASEIPNLTARLIVNTEDGILYCKIATDAGKLGELFCIIMKDGEYREIDGFTGANVRARVMKDVKFPKLLDPVDDFPPATVVTYPPAGAMIKLTDDSLIVRGITTDNVKTKRVVVNGVEAKDVDFNFHQWEARLTGIKPGKLTITALAENHAGNVEQTPHRFTIRVAPR